MFEPKAAWLTGGVLAGLLFYALPVRADSVQAEGRDPLSYSSPATHTIKQIQQQNQALESLQQQLRAGRITPAQFYARLTAIAGAGDKTGMNLDTIAVPPVAGLEAADSSRASYPNPGVSQAVEADIAFSARLAMTLSRLQDQPYPSADLSNQTLSAEPKAGGIQSAGSYHLLRLLQGGPETGPIAATIPATHLLGSIQRPTEGAVNSTGPKTVDAVAHSKQEPPFSPSDVN